MFQLPRDAPTKGKQGWRRPLQPTVSQAIELESQTSLLTHSLNTAWPILFDKEEQVIYTWKLNIWKPNLIQKTLFTPTLFLISDIAMVCFIQEWKNRKSMLFIMYIEDVKQKQQIKWPTISLSKKNRKENTLQNQPKHHLNWRGPSLVFLSKWVTVWVTSRKNAALT
jgi:hypothetical protein